MDIETRRQLVRQHAHIAALANDAVAPLAPSTREAVYEHLRAGQRFTGKGWARAARIELDAAYRLCTL
jgi:hypothetical protein